MRGCGGTGVSGKAEKSLEALERYYMAHSLIISISLPFFFYLHNMANTEPISAASRRQGGSNCGEQRCSKQEL